MKFDFVIGNPPYQGNTTGDNETYAAPVYQFFMNAAFEIADRVELITPARFLFNAGSTPTQWNQEMINDPHFKVLKYVQKSDLVFPGTDIKGGVAICYHDLNKTFGKIGLFTSNPILSGLAHKVSAHPQFTSISDWIYSPYTFTHLIHQEHPEIVERHPELRNRYDLAKNIFTKLENILFFKHKPNDEHEYVQIYGLLNNKRQYVWIKKEYIKAKQNWNKYKLFVPRSNGSGAIGEVLSTPLIGEPLIGHTQTFLTIGCFESKDEALNCLKYIKTKFARVMLGVLKITQDNSKRTWGYVPQQNFSFNSDINWEKPINEIDAQLYRKYNLTEEEKDFIESNVKPMND